VAFRVASEESLDFWQERVGGTGSNESLLFDDPEGLGLELVVDDSGEVPLQARHPEVPQEHALRGFAGVRAYGAAPEASAAFLSALGFEDGWVVRGGDRSGFYVYDPPPAEGVQGAGTVHHVAFAAPLDEHARWVERVRVAGGRPTDVIDRFWFRSIYFREPSGVLFEIASLGPGFQVDEDPEHLGEKLILPPAFEHLRAEIEPKLTPLPNPRQLISRATSP
jgi:glyoxalase family protein